MALVHPDSHPLAGKTITVKLKGAPHQRLTDGVQMEVEDWWSIAHEDNELGSLPALLSSRSPAAINYIVRAQVAGIPLDDDVIYGKVFDGQPLGLGYIIHSSEIGEVLEPVAE